VICMVWIFLLFLLIFLIYFLSKLILFTIVKKFGKISYDGFNSFGFIYDEERDTFDSSKEAWQKNFGYTHLYDVGAPLFGIIVDTEPVRFYYDKKNWLISFWKGQYGMATGAEVGVYYTEHQKISKRTIYFPVEDSEMLDMSFILYKRGKYLTRISAKHWWLATFKLGMFSNPRELSMCITIKFPNQEMLDAFLEAFKKLKHSSKSYKIIDETFCFDYKKPKSHKVWTRCFITDFFSQFFNHKKIEIYNDYLDGLIDNNGIDDSKNNNLIIVNNLVPDIFKNDNLKLKRIENILGKIHKNNILVGSFENHSGGKL